MEENIGFGLTAKGSGTLEVRNFFMYRFCKQIKIPAGASTTTIRKMAIQLPETFC